MKTHKELPNKLDTYYKLTGREVLLTFYNVNEVATMEQVNDNWVHYKNVDTDMILLDNSMSIDGQDLENVHIKIIKTTNDILEVKIFGKLYPKFQTNPQNDISELTDCVDCFISKSDFDKYTKLVVHPTASTKALYDQISDVAKTIIHDDEYGYVFYNTKTKQIWWCASDGFEGDDSEDTESDIVTKFSKIKEVKSVVIELEHMPNNEDEDEDDYDENWEEIKYK